MNSIRDELGRLYAAFDTELLRERQSYLVERSSERSSLAVTDREEIRRSYETQCAHIERAHGPGFVDIAARVPENDLERALDLYDRHGRAFNALVLDVDETLRSPAVTDDRIPTTVFRLLRHFAERNVPVVICTGQTAENVKGFLIQGLGSNLFHSGDISVVYEAGSGVLTPNHGQQTKQHLYEQLDDRTRQTFEQIRAGVSEASLRGGYLQGNEFNVTLKPNADVGSSAAADAVDRAIVELLDIVGKAVAGPERGSDFARVYYAARDDEVHGVLSARDELPAVTVGDVPDRVHEQFERIDVLYYEGAAAEIGSPELSKAKGARSALATMGVDDPFVLAMGDSRSDVRVMRWAHDNGHGVGAAPTHCSAVVREFVEATSGLFFEPGNCATMLRTAYALDSITGLATELPRE